MVVGGGAAGLAAAIAAAGKARAEGISACVRIFEADDRVGRSLLATGNGRCNFSNKGVTAAAYYGESFVSRVFEALEQRAIWPVQAGENAVLAFFSSAGLWWREEGEGRLFPRTGKASTVLDVLRAMASALGVLECCNMRVRSVEPPRETGKPYTLRMVDGAFERAQAVICAVGGAVSRALLPDTLSYTPIQPVLGPLKTDVRAIRALDNIRVRCAVSVERTGCELSREKGEVLFRKYGLSGISIFNLSRFAQPGDAVILDVVPEVAEEELAHLLGDRVATSSVWAVKPTTCEDVLRGLTLPLVSEALLKAVKLKPTDPATSENLQRIAHIAKRFSLEVEGVGDTKQCQVHRGGFSCEEFDPATMESRFYPGLFAAGEMLDVDGPCGGYNLHWAWSSGLLAGLSVFSREGDI